MCVTKCPPLTFEVKALENHLHRETRCGGIHTAVTIVMLNKSICTNRHHYTARLNQQALLAQVLPQDDGSLIFVNGYHMKLQSYKPDSTNQRAYCSQYNTSERKGLVMPGFHVQINFEKGGFQYAIKVCGAHLLGGMPPPPQEKLRSFLV